MSAGDVTIGRRREVQPGGDLPADLTPGDYWKSGVDWWAVVPHTGYPVGVLSNHSVTEHEDLTITVSPSILMTGAHGIQWHGYLERGVWREV